MPVSLHVCLAVACLGWLSSLAAQVPPLVHHQGRVLVNGLVSDGPAWFKFALANVDGSQVYWSNAPDLSPADGEPDEAVTLTLDRGLYSVLLGDASLEHMAAIPPEVFNHSEVYLRIWCDPDGSGFLQLAPDQRVAAVGYAMMAATVSDGAITAGKLSSDALGTLPSDVAGLQSLVATQADQIAALQEQVAALLGDTGLVPGLTAVSAERSDAGLQGLGFEQFSSLAAPGWVNGSTAGAPSARSGHTAVWTGLELIVWGGEVAPGQAVAGGALYRPEADAWSLVSTVRAPAARSRHSAVWTGTEMIVWGGFAGGAFLDSGARFEPDPQHWAALPIGPAGRVGHVAVWTGSHVLVWGGRNATGLLADGALFDPVAGTWSSLNLPDAPSARTGTAAAWGGDRLLLWGGEGAIGPLGDGAALVFDGAGQPDHWEVLSATDAPAARMEHTAVWSGERFLVWGGRGLTGARLGDGASYDPATDAWEALPDEGAPSPRSGQVALWAAGEMLVVTGETAAGVTADGAAFKPATGKWRPLSGEGNPLPRSAAAGAWTGADLEVFGGLGAGGQRVAALQRLVPQPVWYLYRKP